MRSLKSIFALGAFVFIIAQPALSREIRWTHFGLRPLGMGNAYVAVADDYNALFYNPAGLARLKDWDFEFLNPAVEAAQQTLDTISDLTKLSGGSADGVSQVLDILKEQTGKVHYMGMHLTPHFVTKGFGIGVGFSLPVSLVTHSNINVDVEGGTRVVAPVGFAHSFFEDRLSIGASLKFFMQNGVDQEFNIQTISLFSDKDGFSDLFESGSGYGADVGLLFTPIEQMEPTLGISVTDLGGSPYKPMQIGGTSGELKAPPSRLPSVNTGVSFKPIQTDKSYLLAAVDAHFINQPYHYSHKLNLGMEWGYSQLIKVQAGLKEGYFTAGLQFDVGVLNLRLSTYAVDHAPVVGTHPSLVERRFAMQLKMLI